MSAPISPSFQSESNNITKLSLDTLPAELVFHILSFLSPASLTQLSCTSKYLRSHSLNDLLWEQLVRQNVAVSTPLPSHEPAESWRQLYIAAYPYWFLVRHQVWFSDRLYSGDLIITKYDHETSSILGLPMQAVQRSYTAQPWAHDPSIYIHNFDPEVSLAFDHPVIKLSQEKPDLKTLPQKGRKMELRSGVSSTISLCQTMPSKLEHPSMSLWPPATIPSVPHVRNESPTKFRSNAHWPKSISEASDSAFRLHRPRNFGLQIASINMSQDVTTWSALPHNLYTPTEEKPWQGIWVGDYSAHGCEFLLVLHKEKAGNSNMRPARRSSTSSGLPSGLVFLPADSEEAVIAEDTPMTAEEGQKAEIDPRSETEVDRKPSGRLEAIKLTGDANVPRGEITWFADDIGDSGSLGTATDDLFKGSRMVRSMGHIANRGFQDDRFIDSRLIMKDHDTLAQHWENFGHISFYKRVNLDELIPSGERAW